MPTVLLHLVRVVGLRRLAKVAGALLVVSLLVWLVAIPLLVASVAAGAAQDDTSATGGCTPTGGTPGEVVPAADPGTSGPVSGWDAEAVRNAQEIARRGVAAGVGQQGVVVALATAMQESGLHNLDYGDRDSLGLFQQRPSTGWGTREQILDPSLSADAFYGVAAHTGNTGLVDLPGWQSMTVAQAAQAVQRSAFPDAYTRWESSATQLAARVLEGADLSQVLCTGSSPVVSGEWANPLSPARYVATSPFGMRRHPITGVWKLHSGQDLAAPIGTQIRSVCTGVVTQTGPQGSGGLTTTVDCGGGIEAFYMHQSVIGVDRGARVSAGQVLGAVGNTGGSTGPHLHLGVRAGGVPTDPVPFLVSHGIGL